MQVTVNDWLILGTMAILGVWYLIVRSGNRKLYEDGRFKLIGPREAAELIEVHQGRDDLVLLDTRTPAEFSRGALPGAVNLALVDPDLAAKLAELSREKTYLIYCLTGHRSTRMLKRMAPLGFERAANLKGGLIAWRRAGLDGPRKI